MQTAKPARIDSVDFLRGLVIVIMALDHVRDYTSNVRFDPLDPDQTNALLFATRWVTHFCAPVFVFLAGTAGGFQRRKGKPVAELSRFLLTRGLWLVFLELTVVLFGWKFNFTPLLFMQVIWAIGASMVVLAALVWLPLRAIAAIGAVMILGHNLLDPLNVAAGFQAPATKPSEMIWLVLHQLGPMQIGPVAVFIAYPLIPWIGVMALGYAFAEFYGQAAERRQSLLLKIGLGAIAAFFILRGVNLYGDPTPWRSYDTIGKTAMSYFNVQKYPPSLLFLLATLGPAMIVLSFAERWKSAVVDFFVTFGRVPLFFYILHIYLAHLVAIALAVAQGHPASSVMVAFFFFPPDYGVGLGWVYLLWIAVVLALYFPCQWFMGVKRRSTKWWMSYF